MPVSPTLTRVTTVFSLSRIPCAKGLRRHGGWTCVWGHGVRAWCGNMVWKHGVETWCGGQGLGGMVSGHCVGTRCGGIVWGARHNASQDGAKCPLFTPVPLWTASRFWKAEST
eukprot:363745-Chlamydomonas_euryale.AAC.2